MSCYAATSAAEKHILLASQGSLCQPARTKFRLSHDRRRRSLYGTCCNARKCPQARQEAGQLRELHDGRRCGPGHETQSYSAGVMWHAPAMAACVGTKPRLCQSRDLDKARKLLPAVIYYVISPKLAAKLARPLLRTTALPPDDALRLHGLADVFPTAAWLRPQTSPASASSCTSTFSAALREAKRTAISQPSSMCAQACGSVGE